MQSPTDKHQEALKQLMRYLKSTVDYGILISPQTFLVFHAFSDGDWVGDPSDRVSATEFLLYLGIIPISQTFRKQKSTARSSTEVEYRAVAFVASEVMWVQSLLIGL